MIDKLSSPFGNVWRTRMWITTIAMAVLYLTHVLLFEIGAYSGYFKKAELLLWFVLLLAAGGCYFFYRGYIETR